MYISKGAIYSVYTVNQLCVCLSSKAGLKKC